MPKGVPKEKQVSINRFMDFRNYIHDKYQEDLGANVPDEKTFKVIEQGISELLRMMEKPEYLVITSLQSKGVSQAKGFLQAAKDVLERIDEKVYY